MITRRRPATVPAKAPGLVGPPWSAGAYGELVRLICEGRASQIFDLGDGQVFRRFKRGGDAEHEARFMRLAGAGGFPVPRVLGVRSDGLVLEKIDGPTMRGTLGDARETRRRPP